MNMINLSTPKEVAKKPEVWVPIMALNPATSVFIAACGIIAFAAIKLLFKAKNKNEPLPTVKKPLLTVPQPLNQPLKNNTSAATATVQPYNGNTTSTVKSPIDPLKEEAEKKEMLRKIMSDLGKKSAAARARKRIQ
jgi:hypothetical protein